MAERRTGKKSAPSLVHSPNVHNGLVRANPKLEARNSIQLSCVAGSNSMIRKPLLTPGVCIRRKMKLGARARIPIQKL